MKTPLIRALVFIIGLFLVNLLFLAQGFYEEFVYLDDIVHFLGGCSIAFLIIQLIFIVLHLKDKKIIASLTILITFVVALSWELMEFTSDHLLGSHLQMGVADTITDLLMGTSGALFVVLVTLSINKKPRA